MEHFLLLQFVLGIKVGEKYGWFGFLFLLVLFRKNNIELVNLKKNEFIFCFFFKCLFENGFKKNSNLKEKNSTTTTTITTPKR